MLFASRLLEACQSYCLLQSSEPQVSLWPKSPELSRHAASEQKRLVSFNQSFPNDWFLLSSLWQCLFGKIKSMPSFTKFLDFDTDFRSALFREMM